MKTTPPYQHQLHYQITQTDSSALRTRLTASAPAVRSACGIHMLCFSSCLPSWDEPQFALYYYDNDPTYLLLERWLDTSRTSTMVAEAECRALLSGETDWLLERCNPVLRDFHDGLTQRLLLPHVMLTFHREVYALDGLDLWVALDSDVRSSLEHMDFLDPELLARDTAGQEGSCRLEISYSDAVAIPDEVLCLLAETAPRRRPLSGTRPIVRRQIAAYT